MGRREGRVTGAGCVCGRVPQSARRALVVALWLTIWQLAAFAVGTPLILPGPVEVCVRLGALASEVPFWLTVASTIAHFAYGFVLAFVGALVLGSVAERWPVAEELLRPPVAVLRSTPIVCVIVLLLLWVGSRGVSAIAAFVAAFAALYYSVREGMAQLDGVVAEMLAIFRVGRLRRTLAHTWPGIVPYLAAACEASCSMAFKAAVAAELIGTPIGTVGERIYQAKLLLETADVLAWTLTVVLIANICSHAFVAALRASGRVSLRLAVALSARHLVEPAEPSAVTLTDVVATYDGRVVLDGVTLHLAAGSRTVVRDASGAGKTTLLRVIARLKRVDVGVVDAPVVSVMFQEPRLVETLTAVDNVVLASGVGHVEAAAALAEVLPDADTSLPVRALSGGQRRRVELVRALLASSGAVLLDEPFASLDAVSRAACSSFALARLAGRTLLVASHDGDDARLLGAEEVRLFPGRSGVLS